MITKIHNKKHKLGRIFIAVALILGGIIFLIDLQVRPIIEKTAMYQSKIVATRIINNVVYKVLNNEFYDYNSLVDITYNDEEGVSSLRSNMVNINRLNSEITDGINESLNDMSDYNLSISLGTVTGLHMFYGQGPEIPIKVQPAGYVETTLISEFSDAGINQTLHRIIIKISIDISAIIPGYTTSAELKSDYIVAETVIVGEIPSSYTRVISGDSDLIGDINDYGS